MRNDPMRHTARGNIVDGNSPIVPTEDRLSDGQHADHYVLSPADLATGFVEPYRDSYVHDACGGVTRMPAVCAQTYAAQPEYYGSTFCCHCQGYFPVGEN